MNMQQLLKEIASGVHSFNSPSNSIADLESFQSTADLIIEAYNAGYVDKLIRHNESETGHNYFDCMVVGGITNAGNEIASDL